MTWADGAKMIFAVGMAAYEAWKSGNTTKTVGEIFDEVGTDMDKLRELENARFGEDA